MHIGIINRQCCFTLTVYALDAAWCHVVSIPEDRYMLDDIAKP